MKRLVVLICVLATFSLSAQEGRHEHGRQGARMMNDLSPEQTATLKTKKMTLGLDLTEDQQEKIYKIHLNNAKEKQARMDEVKKKREAGESLKPSKEDRFNRLNEKLDMQIAHKKEMKGILSKEQFEKWEQGAKRKSHLKNKKRRNRSKGPRR